MTPEFPPRPIARPVRVVALLLALVAILPLALGGLTTSFKAGMDDPNWPTEPWFLIVNGHKYELKRNLGFLMEHTHRLAAWVTGGLASLLAVMAWADGPRFRARAAALWGGAGLVLSVAFLAAYSAKDANPDIRRILLWLFGPSAAVCSLAFLGLLFHSAATLTAPSKGVQRYGLFASLGLLATYGDFHRRMMAVMQSRLDNPGEPLAYPTTQGGMAIGFALLLLGACVVHLFGRERGKWVRALSGFLLVAVMIQGLLGGFRVFFDQLTGWKSTVGVEFSALHGFFAQVVFSAMVCITILAARPRPDFDLPDADRARVGALSRVLVAAVLLQLLWAVWVRHSPTPLAQRLHFLTAFLVFGLGVWLAVRVMSSPGSKKSLGFDARHLIGMLAIQVALGVEAWMMKFGTTAAIAELVASDARPISVGSGIVRTLHQLIGTAILASAVVIVLRVFRRTADAPVEPAAD